jgi:hypothetical protein
MCESARYRDAETAVPASCPHPFPNCIAQPLQNIHVEMSTNSLSSGYELTVHQTADVKELFGNFLTALVYFASLFEMTDEKWHMLYI